MTIMELADKHPAMITTVAVCSVLVVAIFHRTVRVVVDALVGSRRRKSNQRRVPQVPVEHRFKDAQCALVELGFTRQEITPALSATRDWEAPISDIVRDALKRIHAANRSAS